MYHMGSQAWDPDHNPELPIALYEQARQVPIHCPHSAPAAFPPTMTQGEIPIGIEPALSPRR